MKRMFVLLSLCLAVVIASATPVSGNSSGKNSIRGEFSTIGTRSCVQADTGGDFGPAPQYQLLSPASIRVYQVAGVLRLFGDGHGSWSGKQFMISNSQVTTNAYPISVFVTDCDVKYKNKKDGTIEFTYTNCDGPITAGYWTGSTTGSYTDVVESAMLSADGNTLVFSELDPSVETTWLTTTAGVTTTYKRICSRTGIAIRQPDKGH
jgi:hypothetical protein